MTDTLRLSTNDYQQSKKLFEEEKDRLLILLNKFDIKIEHIGNTAIPKSIGKDTIDILLICKNKQTQLQIKDVLTKHNYTQGELDKKPDGRLFFFIHQNRTQNRDIHLHLVTQNSTSPSNLVSLKIRDFLLDHPDEVEAYNQEKTRLADATNNNRHNYAVQKEEYIKKLLAKIS